MIEEGTHTELMEKQGAYYNLVMSQGLNDTEEEGKNKPFLSSNRLYPRL